MRSRQRGLTFIELSLTLVLLGLIASLLASLTPAIKRLAITETAIEDVVQIEDAMAGFALAMGRLPCADTDQDGTENCPAVSGQFPYLTAGMGAPLRNIDGQEYHYGVYFRPGATPMQDASLTEQRERWYPTLASGLPPSAKLTSIGNLSHLDFCRGLSSGLAGTVDTGALHLVRLAANEAVAYVLVNPGSADLDGNGALFDGINATGAGFEHPARPADSNYDDSVGVGYFSTLWERMGCSGLLSAAGHAHPNTLSTLAMFRQSLRDYEKQLELTEEMGLADTVQQAATIAASVAGVATAVATAPTATASAISTFGAAAPAVAASGVAIGLNSAATAAAGAQQYVVTENYVDIQARVDEVGRLIDTLDNNHDSVADNAKQADNDALSDK